MKKQTYLDTARKDLFAIDMRLIDIDPNYNTRQDFGADFNELVESIFTNGVQVPMMVKRNPEHKDRYILIRGHRRLAAINKLFEKGRLDESLLRVPCQMQPKGTNDVDMLVDQITSNMGKPLTILETAEVVKRLLAFELTEKEIASKLGKSTTFVSNLAKISELPVKIKNLIKNGTVSTTLVMELFRQEKDFSKITEQLEAAMQNTISPLPENMVSEAKVKVTKKDVQKATGKFNSYAYLKKAFRTNNKQEHPKLIRADKKELYEFTTALMEGSLSPADLEELFFDKGEIKFVATTDTEPSEKPNNLSIVEG